MRHRVLPIIALLSGLLLGRAYAQDRGLVVARQAVGTGGYYALLIGNNNYKNLPKLRTAEGDARELASLLKESYGFETTLLLDATRAQIVSALAAYRRKLGPDSHLLIYYAGHGYNDSEQDKAYWLPVDATTEDPANWIIADEVTSAVRVMPARQVLVVSDSCYSGMLTREVNPVGPPAAGVERERFLEKMAAGRARVLMASGGNEPVVDGGGGGHSVFTAALLRGLREMDGGRFTASELFRSYVLEPVAGRAEQTPEYNPIRNSGHESGDFVFVKVGVGEKNLGLGAKVPLSPSGGNVGITPEGASTTGSTVTKPIREAFSDLLVDKPTLEEIKAFIRANPEILDGVPRLKISGAVSATLFDYPVGDAYRPFATMVSVTPKFSQVAGQILFVEVARETSKVFSDTGALAPELQQAWDRSLATVTQAKKVSKEYQRRLASESSLTNFREHYPHYEAIIIIGRRASLTKEELLKLQELSERSDGGVKVVTYDALLDR